MLVRGTHESHSDVHMKKQISPCAEQRRLSTYVTSSAFLEFCVDACKNSSKPRPREGERGKVS